MYTYMHIFYIYSYLVLVFRTIYIYIYIYVPANGRFDSSSMHMASDLETRERCIDFRLQTFPPCAPG